MANRFTEKQKQFIYHYVHTLSGVDSVILAGYDVKSRDVARSIGAENLAKPHIRQEIDRQLQQSALTAQETLRLVKDIALGNVMDYIREDGSVDLAGLKKGGAGRVVKKYKSSVKSLPLKAGGEIKTTTFEIELYPADAAHEKLMKYHGLYQKDNAVQVNIHTEIKKLLEAEQITLEDVREEWPELADEFAGYFGS